MKHVCESEQRQQGVKISVLIRWLDSWVLCITGIHQRWSWQVLSAQMPSAKHLAVGEKGVREPFLLPWLWVRTAGACSPEYLEGTSTRKAAL